MAQWLIPYHFVTLQLEHLRADNGVGSSRSQRRCLPIRAIVPTHCSVAERALARWSNVTFT